jgi:hypothetical protein
VGLRVLGSATAEAEVTPRERRLERRLCERERELIRAETDRAWYFERWMLATTIPGLAGVVAGMYRVRCEVRRMARSA